MAAYEKEISDYDGQAFAYDAVKGCCRTADGGHGDYTTYKELNETGCQDACTALPTCLAYEFGEDCELHAAAISFEDEEDTQVETTCYVKRSQLEMPLDHIGSAETGPEDFPDWERWTGIHCTGLQAHEMPEYDAETSQINDLTECIELCEKTPRCSGVQTQDPFHGCWLRTKADLKTCYAQPPWVMYTRPGSFSDPPVDGSTGPPWLILGILLCIGAIALAGFYLWKMKLLCFKEEQVKLTDAEAQSFKKMDLDGDGVITQKEFAQYQQERSCNTCWGGGDSKDDK